MNRRRLLLIGFVAVLLGGFVSTFVYRTLQKHLAPEKESISVVVAAHDLAVGQKLQDQDLKFVRYPADYSDRRKLRTMTIMQDVLVMPASPEPQTSARRDPNVVTLLVSPENAQRLALAHQTG